MARRRDGFNEWKWESGERETIGRGDAGPGGWKDQPQVPLERQRWPGAHCLPLQVQSPAPQVPAEPALQEADEVQPHPPLTQENPGGQVWPQAPQFAASTLRSRQPAGVWQQVMFAPQLVLPLQAHTAVLPDLTQVSLVRQAVPPQEQSPVAVSHVPVTPWAAQAPLLAHPHRFFGR